MPSNHTPNYQLSQWERSDKVLMDDFNADNAKIDAAIKAVDAAKADKAVVDSLSQRVNAKADQSALDSLSGTVSGHTAALSKKGNCTVVRQTYTGTGRYGSSGSTTRSFPGQPLLVVFSGGGNSIIAANGEGTVYARAGTSSQALSATWSGNSVSLNSTASAAVQMNAQGNSYSVLAFISES